MESCFGYILFSIYFIIIPVVVNMMWLDDKSDKSFIKWYFTKSDRVNWLGYFIFFILGLGCIVWILFWYFCVILFYTIFLPLCWLFEFLFLNKDCSHIVCKDLKKYKKEL
jgi:small-conductance mechanosensitive channel